MSWLSPHLRPRLHHIPDVCTQEGGSLPREEPLPGLLPEAAPARCVWHRHIFQAGINKGQDLPTCCCQGISLGPAGAVQKQSVSPLVHLCGRSHTGAAHPLQLRDPLPAPALKLWSSAGCPQASLTQDAGRKDLSQNRAWVLLGQGVEPAQLRVQGSTTGAQSIGCEDVREKGREQDFPLQLDGAARSGSTSSALPKASFQGGRGAEPARRAVTLPLLPAGQGGTTVSPTALPATGLQLREKLTSATGQDPCCRTVWPG